LISINYKRPFVNIALFFCLGVIAASFFNITKFLATAIMLSVLLLSFACLLLNKKQKISGFILIIVFFSGMLRFADSKNLEQDNISFFIGYKKQTVRLKGTVDNNPVFFRKYGYLPTFRFILEPSQIYINSSFYKTTGKVLVDVRADTNRLPEYAQNIEVEGMVFRPYSKNFDYEKYLQSKGIFALMDADTTDDIKILGKARNPITDFLRHLYRVKNEFKNFLEVNTSKNASFVLSAMFLGDRDGLSKNIKNIFIKSGTMHVLAISGLHVSIIAGAIFAFLMLFRINQKIVIIITILILMCYAIFTGSKASVCRATIMTTIFLLGFIFTKTPDAKNIYALTLFVMLALNPYYIYNTGFILSFFCVFPIIWFYPVVRKVVHKTLLFNPPSPVAFSGEASARFSLRQSKDKKSMDANPRSFKKDSLLPKNSWKISLKRLSGYIVELFLVSCVIWIFILPLSAYFFHLITPVSIIVNLFAIPLTALILICMVMAMFFYFIAPFISLIILISVNFFVNVLISILKYFSEFNLLIWKIPNIPFLYIIAYYVAFLVGVILIKKNTVRNKIVTFL